MSMGFGVSSARWADIHLDKETEHAAAQATLAFLKRVHKSVTAALELSGQDALREQLRVSFDEFDPAHLDFVLATVASGEVRISANKGKVKAEETQITGLWRVEENGRQYFVFGSIPDAILQAVRQGLQKLEIPETAPEGVFSAPAILKELASALSECKAEEVDFDPPHMVELTRQPVERIDMQWLKTVLGQGETEVWLSGFANARMQSTNYRCIWRSTLLNKAGKTLLDSFIVTLLPPEIPASPDEFSDAERQCREIIDWLEGDLARGVL